MHLLTIDALSAQASPQAQPSERHRRAQLRSAARQPSASSERHTAAAASACLQRMHMLHAVQRGVYFSVRLAAKAVFHSFVLCPDLTLGKGEM